MSPFYHVLNFLLLITSANACIWDRDTLRIEADAKPDILETTTGRFPRFPDRYYEMRLIETALKDADGHQGKAAELLNLSYHQFRGLLRKHDLDNAAKRKGMKRTPRPTM